MKNIKYKTIDLFAGIGGVRRGFEKTGYFKNVISAEVDKYACETYKHLFGEDPYNDVTSEGFKNSVMNTEYDVLLGGFPCQAFSRAGKEEGFEDKSRGTLFFDIADILSKTRPKAFLLENVDSLITHKKGATFNTIIDILVNDLDYKVIGINKENQKLIYDGRKFVLNTKNFGLPQNRPRVYIMGFDNQRYQDELFNNTMFDSLPYERSDGAIWNNLNELLDYGAEGKYYLSEGYLNTLKKHKERHKSKGNGFGYMVVNLKENLISNALLATGGSGKERNLVRDWQDCIPGKIVSTKKSPLNNECIRVMTPDEWAKLQGFKGYGFLENGEELFSFPPSISNAQRYKQLGNSVSIPVIEELAKKMNECLRYLEKASGDA